MRKLRLGIFAGVWLFGCVLIAAVSTISTVFALREHREDKKNLTASYAAALTLVVERSIHVEDRKAVKALLEIPYDGGETAYAFIELEGGIYVQAFETAAPRIPPPAGRARSGPLTVELTGEDGHVLYDVSVPLLGGAGRLHLGLDRSTIDRHTMRSLRTSHIHSLFAMLLGGFLAAVIAFFSTQEVARALEERREMETRVHQTQKIESLGILAGGIAHDFNNILGSIIGNAELTLEDLPEDSPLRARISAISSVSRRASGLCRQMLTYAGRARISIRSVDLSRLVREAGVLLKAALPKKIKFEFTPGEDLPAVRADPAQIQQVIMNLITNAAEAIGDREGSIRVRTGSMRCGADFLRETYLKEDLPEGLYVYLEVADDGGGMDSTTMKKLFDPFFTTKKAGTGLGLTAVLGVMRTARGALTVSSKPGMGSTFRLFFPAAEKAAATENGLKEDGDWRGEGKVLVVDDEAQMRDVAREVLKRMGFSVADCADGREALARFRETPDDFTLIVLDLSMPRMSGEEMLHELRRIRADTPVICTSGYDKDDAIGRLSGNGPDGFIPKPFELANFRREIRRVLTGSEP